jgi:glycosyltransferase involved in cell wall biosynthesis
VEVPQGDACERTKQVVGELVVALRAEQERRSVMNGPNRPIRVLYSYGLKLGASRICYTAWQQVNGLAATDAEIVVFPGVLQRPLPSSVKVRPTLARGKFRIPYKSLGTIRALSLHDYIVSRRIEKLAGQIDIIHTWPSAALQTLKAAARLKIPTVLERPNAHTRFAYTVVQEECNRLGLKMPEGHEHAFKEEVLRREEEEFRLADCLLCPSDFVVKTFIDFGFPPEKLTRHQYGFDEKEFTADGRTSNLNRGLIMLFVGGCAPRKGLHFALDAWLKSTASQTGTFLIAGEFIPGYAEKLRPMLSHPSVHVLGHRSDVAELMRKSDILTLPSIEEGSALVTSEARGSGCVLLVSDAAGAICEHMKNALVHRVGDVETLTEHINMLHNDRALLQSLQSSSISTIHEITWKAAGLRLLDVYKETIKLRKIGSDGDQFVRAEHLRE